MENGKSKSIAGLPEYAFFRDRYRRGDAAATVLTARRSNYDWGQDLRLLAGRLREQGVQTVSLAITEDAGYGPQTHYAYLEAWYGLPHAQQVNTCVPAPGWNVVSTTVEKSLSYWPGARYYRGPGTPAEWYEKVDPTERLGPLLLFNIPQDSKLRSDNCNVTAVH